MRVLLINCVSDTPEVNLYRGLHMAGVSLSLILDPRDSAAEMLRNDGIPVEQVTIRNRFDFRFDAFVRQAVGDFKPDIIHAPTSRGVASALRVSKGTGIKVMSYRGTLGNLSRFSLEARLAHLHPRLNGIFCNCKAVQTFLKTCRIPEERLPVVYKGHRPEWYTASEAHKRSSLEIDEDAFVVGCFANIRPLKGVDVLVRAIEALPRSSQSVVCLLVGEARDKKLRAYVEQHALSDRVRFLGFRDDVARLLPLCDVTVMPSVRREGFPRAIVESYSNGVPVVCTAVGGMPELVQHDKSGLVVEPGNVEELARALHEVRENPVRWRTAGQTGKDRVETLLSLERYVDSTIEAYQSVLNRD